jgi:hypothetical protein
MNPESSSPDGPGISVAYESDGCPERNRFTGVFRRFTGHTPAAFQLPLGEAP